MAKPFLRWAGSKHQLVPELLRYWPGASARYVEPFAGSARLFFELEPTSAILCDLNADLMKMYEVVRDRPEQVEAAWCDWVNDKDEYYRLRALDPESLSAVDRAARFIYLNRFCFNGLYRTNCAGSFNVPYGGTKTGQLPTKAQLRDASHLLTHADLLVGDFTSVLRHVRKGDFVYLDPPFSVQSRRLFTEYGPTSFGPADLKRLRTFLEAIHERGAIFLLSYADSSEGQLLASAFHSAHVITKRNIAGFAAKRRSARELLVSNTELEV